MGIALALPILLRFAEIGSVMGLLRVGGIAGVGGQDRGGEAGGELLGE